MLQIYNTFDFSSDVEPRKNGVIPADHTRPDIRSDRPPAHFQLKAHYGPLCLKPIKLQSTQKNARGICLPGFPGALTCLIAGVASRGRRRSSEVGAVYWDQSQHRDQACLQDRTEGLCHPRRAWGLGVAVRVGAARQERV